MPRMQQTKNNLFARRTLSTFGSSSNSIGKITCLHDRPFAWRLALFSSFSFKINHRDRLAQGAPRPGFSLGGPRPERWGIWVAPPSGPYAGEAKPTNCKDGCVRVHADQSSLYYYVFFMLCCLILVSTHMQIPVSRIATNAATLRRGSSISDALLLAIDL